MKHDAAEPVVMTVRRDGTIELTAATVQRMGFKPGDRVSVRVSDAAMSQKLLELGVTEAEIDAITERQLEARNNVERFLGAEGVLSRSTSFRTRIQRWSR